MSTPSGRFVVRIPPRLHAELQAEARRGGESLNRVCVRKLSAAPTGRGQGLATAAEVIPRSLLRRIRQRFAEGLVGIVLFGSAARGDSTEASDVDLLLVLPPGAVLSRELYRRWDSLSVPSEGAEIPGSFSPQFAVLPGDVSDAGGLWFEVALEGIVLWERDRAVSRSLRGIRTAMAAGLLRRSTIHGTPYWVRNFGPARHEE